MRGTGRFLSLESTGVPGRKLPSIAGVKATRVTFRSLFWGSLVFLADVSFQGFKNFALSGKPLSEDGWVRTAPGPVPVQLDSGNVGSQLLLGGDSEVSDALVLVWRETVLLAPAR